MTNIQQNGTIRTKIENNITTVTFGHPASNSFPSSLLQELAEAFNSVSENEAVTVIILQSEGGKAFCAGASFDELLAITNLEEGMAFFAGFANVINAMRKCNKLIIGKVQGKAVGGGVGLAAACDYVFATEKAAIKLSEFTIGIGPFVIAPAVERKIGISGLAALTLDAENWKSADWAKEKGLYSEVVSTEQRLNETTEIFAKKLSAYNPQALFEMKKVLWKNTENWDDLLLGRAKISGKLVLSEFTKEALKKFKNSIKTT